MCNLNKNSMAVKKCEANQKQSYKATKKSEGQEDKTFHYFSFIKM